MRFFGAGRDANKVDLHTCFLLAEVCRYTIGAWSYQTVERRSADGQSVMRYGRRYEALKGCVLEHQNAGVGVREWRKKSSYW